MGTALEIALIAAAWFLMGWTFRSMWVRKRTVPVEFYDEIMALAKEMATELDALHETTDGH
jgi:hypothetical protein